MHTDSKRAFRGLPGGLGARLKIEKASGGVKGQRSLTVLLRQHQGPEVDGVEGGTDHTDETAENEHRPQVPGHGAGSVRFGSVRFG